MGTKYTGNTTASPKTTRPTTPKTTGVSTPLTTLSPVKDISVGWTHSMILKEDGSCWTTGKNMFGQLGDGTTDDKSSFVKVVDSNVKFMSAGGYHSMVLKTDN